MTKAKYTKRDVAHMHRIYRQTMSLAATAKVYGCCPSTVRRYRDLQKWVTPQQIKQCRQDGNEITLTPDIAIKLAAGWQLQIQDIDLCPIVGITIDQLKKWLLRNTPVTIVVNVKDQEGKEFKRTETIGLRHLREREWANLEYSFLHQLKKDAADARDAKDYKTAANITEWILSKRMPKKFAESAININMSQSQQQAQSNVVSVDELDLPLETRKQILAKIREKKQIKGK